MDRRYRAAARSSLRRLSIPLAVAVVAVAASATRAHAQAPPRPGARRAMLRDSLRAPHLRRQAAPAAATSPLGPQVVLTFGPAVQVLKPDAFNMSVPDMHTAVTQGLGACPQGSRTYCLFLTGVIGGPAGLGSTALLTTTDFEKGSAYAAPQGVTQPVFKAPCRNRVAPEDCRLRFDAGYRGANLVFKTGGSWVMIYHGETRTFTDGSAPGAPWKSFPHTPAYAEVGLARSADGIHWQEPGTAIITGSDPKPSLSQVNGLTGLYGTPEPGAIIAKGSAYVFFPYIPSPGSPDANQPAAIQVAKATLASMGSSGSGTWYKFDGGRWDQPGMGGRGSAVVSTAGCTRPAQPWVGYSKAVNRYVMLIICHEGWFFSSATDLEHEDWTPLRQVYKPAYPEFTQNQVTDDNFMMVTPGPGATLGATGDVLFARDLAWGQHNGVRSLWYRTFTISMSSAIVPPCRPPANGRPGTCI